MKIAEAIHENKKNRLGALRMEREQLWSHWRDLADYFLPRRYIWLMTENEIRNRTFRNANILDGTGTAAARTLASGMMNGITSPSRPWFRLRLADFADDASPAARRWLDEVTRRMLLVMAESNFYNCLAVMYLDLVVFGTSSMLIYEDPVSVISCYNPALGEFFLGQDSRGRVNILGREFSLKVHQIVQEWGLENCSDQVKDKYKLGGGRLQDNILLTHLIEPNIGDGPVPKTFAFREYYWETKGPVGLMLAAKGFMDFPGICPRWEVTGNDSYGTSPAMDALGDVIQLQHETKKKAQGLDKMVSPAMLADIQLEHRPLAMLPNGVTFVAGLSQGAYAGMRPAYQIQIPINELTLDIQEVRQRIREMFHNDLFKMISQLDTVRSATEIDARREEKLVLLGPVLERFEYEGLDPAIARIFGIMERAGLLPEPPPELEGENIEVQYVSILAQAQSAVAAAPVERFLAVIGQVAAAYPPALNIPNWEPLLRDYARDIGVPSKNIRTEEEARAITEQQAKVQAAQEAANTGEVLAKSAKTLSETDVGGGANALQRLLPAP